MWFSEFGGEEGELGGVGAEGFGEGVAEGGAAGGPADAVGFEAEGLGALDFLRGERGGWPRGGDFLRVEDGDLGGTGGREAVHGWDFCADWMNMGGGARQMVVLVAGSSLCFRRCTRTAQPSRMVPLSPSS